MKKQVSILIVEGAGRYCYAAFKMLEHPGDGSEVLAVNDHQTATAYLKKEGAYQKVKTPDLILIELSPADGKALELISFIKNDKKLSVVPIIVFSSAWSKKRVAQCYQNHANGLITKPVNFEKFVDIISGVKDFWLNIAELPKIKDE